MKTAFSFFYGCFYLTYSAFAQEGAFARTAEQACGCFSKIARLEADLPVWEYKADSCVRLALLYNLTALSKETKLDWNSETQLQRVGEDLGRRLFVQCAAYQDLQLGLARARLREESKGYLLDTGVIYNLLDTNAVVPIFKIRHRRDTSLTDYLWMEEFEGADRFFRGLDSFRMRRVAIAYDTLSMFDPAEKRYVQKRVLRRLELLRQKPPLPAPAIQTRRQRRRGQP